MLWSDEELLKKTVNEVVISVIFLGNTEMLYEWLY